MKISNLKVNNFGKLNNKEIELNDGINIIYGENESGKSTLLKFITSMFYGISKNKNGKPIADYEKYTPWNNGEFSGKIKYKLDNEKEFEVFREFGKKNPKIYNESYEDISKEFNIDKTNGNMFFYEQTKVPEELYLSTIISEQNEVKLDDKSQNILVQKMTNIVGTGEDNISFNKIINKLNKKQLEEIGTSRSQDRPINIVTNRLQEIENEKEYLTKFIDEKYNIEEKNKELQEQITESEKELELLKQVRQVIEKEELEKEKLNVKENLINEYKNKIKDINKNKESDKEHNKKTINENLIKEIILLVILIIINIILIVKVKNIVLTTIFLVSTIMLIMLVCYKQFFSKSEIKSNKNTLGVDNKSTQIELINNTIQELNKEVIELNKIIKNNIKSEFEKIRNRYIGILPLKKIDELLEKQAVNYEIDKLQNEINEKKIKLHSIDLDKQNIIPKLESLSKLQEEYECLEEQYNTLNYQDTAINLAKEELEKAYQEMKKTVTPTFTNNLSEIVNKISNGKYKNIKFDDENGIIVEVENGNYVLANNLSIGTIDQLYLSLRLGTCNEISKEKLPIILDEAFAYYDDNRLKNILKYISTENKDRQIIIFTCTNREKKILDELNISYNYIII